MRRSITTCLVLAANHAVLAADSAESPSSFDWYGLAAVVGALAWLPIIVQWFVQRFAKPDLTIVIGNTAELGYTTNGTIFNVELATRGRRKPALITAIDIELEHDNGRRISLFWSGLNEVLSLAETSAGDQASYTRNLPAIAVQVLPDTEVVQRKVLLNDFEQRLDVNHLAGRLVRRLLRIPNAGADEIVATDEFADLVQHYGDGFPWEPGRYAGTLSVTVHELRDPLEKSFEFELSDANVQHIRSNLQLIEDHTRELAVGNNPPAPRFSWYYPILDTPEDAD